MDEYERKLNFGADPALLLLFQTGNVTISLYLN